jgi:hypothetical protein
VFSTTPFVAIGAAGASIDPLATCALTAAGLLWCWGANDAQRLGVMSSDLCFPIPDLDGIDCAATPQPLIGTPAFRSFSVGGGDQPFGVRTCAIDQAASAFCWGEGSGGALGTGATSNTTTPTRVSGTQRFVQVSTGEASTCAVAISGAVYCWGLNTENELGNGGGAASAVPIAAATSARFGYVGVGARHACGLNTDGAALCWGSAIGARGAPGGTVPTPTLAPGNVSFVALSVGRAHQCAVTSTGDAYCWGDNSEGQLGQGTSSGGSAQPLRVSRLPAVVEIRAGGNHSCASTVAGDIYCWGFNLSGELGAGSRFAMSPYPILVNLTASAPGVPTVIVPAVSTSLDSASTGSILPKGPKVRVTDAAGLGVPNVAVTWTVVGGGGSVSGAATVTDDAGFASPGAWRLGGFVGPNTITANAPGLGGTPVTFTAKGVAPGPPVRIGCFVCSLSPPGPSLLVGRDIVLDIPVLPSVRVTDAAGLAVPGVSVTITRNHAGGLVLPSPGGTTFTNADGVVALTRWVLDTIAGVDSVRFAASGLVGSPVIVAVTAEPDEPARLRFLTSPSDTRVGETMTPAVRVVVEDRYGNRVESAGFVTLSTPITPDGGNLMGAITRPTVDGIATFDDLVPTVAGRYSLLASFDTLTSSQQPAFFASGITLAPTAVTIKVDATLALSVTVTLPPGVSTAVTFESSNTGVATVDTNGQVTGVAPGIATITARAVADPGVLATMVVTVTP